MFSATLIIEARRSKGWSQEALAEHAKLSLRTIQRVEQGETVPRGHTVQQLAQALGVPLEGLRLPAPVALPNQAVPVRNPAAAGSASTQSDLRADPYLLELLNYSALSLLVFPLLNLLVPWLLWRARRHDTQHVAEVGRRVLRFQVLWQVGCFFWLLLLLLGQLVLVRVVGPVPGLFLGGVLVAYAVNVVVVLRNARQLRRGRLDLYRFGRAADSNKIVDKQLVEVIDGNTAA